MSLTTSLFVENILTNITKNLEDQYLNLITSEIGFQIENKFMLEVTGGEKGGGGEM